MSIIIEIKVNAKKVARAFKEAPQQLGKNLGKALKKSAFTVQRKSKIISPVDSGLMRKRITPEIKPLSAVIIPRVHYAVYVHEGTRFMAARPFMARGAKASERLIQEFFTESVDDTLKSIERSS